MQQGDRAILYAAVWQAIFGIVCPIRPLTLVADLHGAPPVEAAGIFPRSLWRHSHIRLTEEQFAEASRLIEEAG